MTRITQRGPWHLLRPTGGCYCGLRSGDLITETGHDLNVTCQRCRRVKETTAAKIRALAARKIKVQA